MKMLLNGHACTIALMCAVLLLGAPQAASQKVENSPAGLQAQLEEILKAAKDNDLNRLQSLVSDLEIPSDASWFASTFGDDAGAKLAATYKDSWDACQHHLVSAFQGLPIEKALRFEIQNASRNPRDFTIQAVLAGAQAPLALYTVSVKTKHGVASLAGLYTFVQGEFRVLNWRTLYELPNVTPSRIRLGGDIAADSLEHKVPPVYPDQAKQDGIRGTVVLHAIIDREGYVQQVDYVSGPKELAPNAIAAVKEWRYKPTLLNGDPVEVDTTISVVFKLGH